MRSFLSRRRASRRSRRLFVKSARKSFFRVLRIAPRRPRRRARARRGGVHARGGVARRRAGRSAHAAAPLPRPSPRWCPAAHVRVTSPRDPRGIEPAIALEPLGTIRFRTASTPGSCAASTARTTTYPWDARRRHRARALRRRRSAPPSHPARGLLSRATTEADANARSGKRRRFYFFSRLLSTSETDVFDHTSALTRGRCPPPTPRRCLLVPGPPEKQAPRAKSASGRPRSRASRRTRRPRRSSRLRRRGRVANRPVAPGGEAPRARRRDAHRVQLRERLARRRLGQAVRATGSERGRARGATNRACAATVRGARRRRVREARERANRLLTTPISTLDTRLLH